MGPVDASPPSCPRCGAAAVAPPRRNVYRCPACDEQFFAADLDDEASNQAEPDTSPALAEGLDAARVQRAFRERRSSQKLRQWVQGAALGFGLGASVVVVRMGTYLARGDVRWSWLLPIALLLIYMATRAWIRVVALGREAVASRLPEPDAPPSFDGLGSGSDLARRLDRLTRRDDRG